MKVAYSFTLADSCSGVNCKVEVVDGENVTGRIFSNAKWIQVAVDHRFDVHITHTTEAAKSHVWGLSKCCEMEIALADERYTYYVRNGDIVTISPSENSPGPITRETFRERVPEDDEVNDERVVKVA